MLIGGDLNRHVGAESSGYEDVHGRFGFGDRNVEGIYGYPVDPDIRYSPNYQQCSCSSPNK